MELSDLLDGLNETSLKRTDTLTDRNMHVVKDFMNRRWDEVTAHYENQLVEGRRYYEGILSRRPSGLRKTSVTTTPWVTERHG